MANRFVIEALEAGQFVVRDCNWLTNSEKVRRVNAPIVALFDTMYHCRLFCAAVNNNCFCTIPYPPNQLEIELLKRRTNETF